jgi:hypothetical protein
VGFLVEGVDGHGGGLQAQAKVAVDAGLADRGLRRPPVQPLGARSKISSMFSERLKSRLSVTSASKNARALRGASNRMTPPHP